MNEEIIEYKEDDIINLDDIDFLVVDRLFYSGKYYLYLSDLSNPDNYMYVEDGKEELIEVTDEDLILILMELIVKKHNLHELITEE
jgi:hypothetical protein